jgi:hypothetical protein
LFGSGPAPLPGKASPGSVTLRVLSVCISNVDDINDRPMPIDSLHLLLWLRKVFFPSKTTKGSFMSFVALGRAIIVLSYLVSTTMTKLPYVPINVLMGCRLMMMLMTGPIAIVVAVAV